jgi:hypothetical protein
MTDRDTTRRIGKFYVTQEILRDPKLFESHKAVFGKILPLHIEHQYYKQYAEYIGISELFEPIEVGQVIPLYNVYVEKIYGPLDCIWYHVKAEVVSYSPEDQETVFTG